MIEPRYETLQKLFADRVFRIPPYQRFYSWQRKQRQDLFGDLKKLASINHEQHHFMATVVCYRTPETVSVGVAQYRLYDVVDGQQRLTTLITLLKCIEVDLPADSEVRKDLSKIMVKGDGHLILLQTNNANAHIFNQFIRHGTLPKDGEVHTHSDRNLLEAIEDCKRFVRTWRSTSGDVLGVMRLILQRLGFVVYDTEDTSAVYTLFEVLNSRGLEVDWLDKTKTALMGKVWELSSTEQAAAAEIQNLQGIWTQIYQELAKEDISGEEVLRISATLYYGPGQGKPQSAAESLDLLRNRCKSAEVPAQVSSRLLRVAQKLSTLYGKAQWNAVTDILHARILAIAIMLAEGIDEAERAKLLDEWERVSFRIFGLAQKDSRTKVGDYVKVAFGIATNRIDSRTYNEIMRAMRNLGTEFPVAVWASADAMKLRDWYDSPEDCRYLLWNYEEHLARLEGPGSTYDETERSKIWKARAIDTIEHIFPKNPEPYGPWHGKMHGADGQEQPVENCVGRIGNLLLLPGPLNGRAQRSAFEEKRKVYQRHHIRMIQEVCSESDWTLVEIENREKAIADWARVRWADI